MASRFSYSDFSLSFSQWIILRTYFKLWGDLFVYILRYFYYVPGMMIESMAGKSACTHGLVHDATPFTFSEENSAIDYFGKMLTEGMLMESSQISTF